MRTQSTMSTQTPMRTQTEDRRIVRSKKALRAALISLMESKGFEAITVNDLCSAADLNRGTFYNHFSDKENLLVFLEDEVMNTVARIHSEMSLLSVKDVMAYCVSKKPLPFLVSLFDYFREEGDFLHAVSRSWWGSSVWFSLTG